MIEFPNDQDNTGESSKLELHEQPVSEGTMIDAFERSRPRDRLRRALLIAAAVGFLVLSAIALVTVLGGRDLRLEPVVAAIERSNDSPSDPAAPGPTESIVPTGRTIPKTVYIDSIPDGAEVRVEGEMLGLTPLMIGRAYDGDFATVEVRHAGYHPWRGQVQIVDHGLRADITLKPADRP